MISILRYSFYWLPTPLYLIIGLVLDVFFVFVLFHVVKLVLDLVKFVVDLFGVLIKKVIGWLMPS